MTRPRRFKLGGSGTLPSRSGRESSSFSPLFAADAADFFQLARTRSTRWSTRPSPPWSKSDRATKALLCAGTGFFIDNQGTVLTSSTIIGDNTAARVTFNGVELDARILGNDPRSGLAMLKVAYPDSPFLPLGHSSDLKTGDAVSRSATRSTCRSRPRKGWSAALKFATRAAFSPPPTSTPTCRSAPARSADRCSTCAGKWSGIVVDEPRRRPFHLRAAGRGDRKNHGRFQAVRPRQARLGRRQRG